MTRTYSALLSRDFQKKRKKWVDCRITIDNIANSVSVFELSESGTEAGRKVYSGIVDSKTLLKLTGSEELKLGCVLVSLNDLISDSSNTSADSSKQENLHVMAPAAAYKPKALPFKVPSMSSRLSLSSSYSAVKPVPSQIITEGEESGQALNTRQAPLCSSVDHITSTTTNYISSLSSFSCPTTKICSRNYEDKLSSGGVSSTSRTEVGMNSYKNNIDISRDSAAIGSKSTLVQTLSLPRLYTQRNRRCKLDLVFRSPEQYVRQFMDSLTEEIQLSISSAMCSLEAKALSAMNINFDAPAANTHLNATGSGSSRLTISQLKKPIFTSSGSASSTSSASLRRSPEAVIEKMRSAGIPLATKVEIIVSPPRGDQDGVGHEGAASKWGKGKDKGNDFKFRRVNSNNSTRRASNDCISDDDNPKSGDVRTKCDEHSLEENTKLYFKIGDVRQRNCPQGALVLYLSKRVIHKKVVGFVASTMINCSSWLSNIVHSKRDVYLVLPGAESYGKGDIWLLWRVESRVASSQEMSSISKSSSRMSKGGNSEMTGPESLPRPSGGEIVPMGICSSTSIDAKRSTFIEMKHKHCYPLPWLEGILWQVLYCDSHPHPHPTSVPSTPLNTIPLVITHS